MFKSSSKQKGAATLIFSIIVLILVTFVTLYTARSIITETQVTNNAQRSKIAFQAAESGVAEAFAALSNGRRYDLDGGIFGAKSTTYSDCYSDPGLCSKQINVLSNLNDPTSVIGKANITVSSTYIITSVGLSDDSSATRTITVQTSQAKGIENTPDNPMISRSNVSVTGATQVVNQEGATTVWTGGALTFASGATGTKIADPNFAGYPACMERSFECGTTSASEGTAGVDIITNDSTLAGLSDAEFFANFMGMSISDYRSSNAVTVNIDTNNTISPDGIEYNLFDYINDPAPGEIIFVDGDAKMNGGTLGCTVDASPNFTTRTDGQTQCDLDGGEVQPTTLIVNGDLTVSGNPHFFGIVLVLGDVNASGGFDVTGALLATGKVGESGNPKVWYNSDVIAGTNKAPKINATAGGWRDF
jgi:Tfp pilus assembly protein PilX